MNDLSEKETVEAIRAWWQENGKFIIAGIVLGAGGLFGWNQWQTHEQGQAEAASMVFERLIEAVEKGSEYDARAAAEAIAKDYASTPYAEQARLAMAKLYVEQGKSDEAAAELRALAEGAEPPLSLIARHRLARVLLYQDKPEEALQVLGVGDPGAFRPRFLEVRGDAELALGRPEAAREAWTAALATPGQPPLIDVRLVRMKLDELGVPEPMAEATAATPEDESP